MKFKNFYKKSKRIEFRVDGKPPKKTKPSLWSINSHQTQLVLDLRKKAYEESKKAGLDKHFSGRVKLDLTVYASNTLQRKDTSDYLGDLDALIGGVFESLQPSPPETINFTIHPRFKENKEIGHNVPIIVADDAQISTTVAKKLDKLESYYIVGIEPDN